MHKLMKRPSIAVIGAGAAGCFAAARISRLLPEAEVTVYEGSSSPMAKLSVTGGGRCNLTNTFEGVRSLEEVYPRGSSLMKRLLKHFGPRETMEWFRNEGLPLTVLPDGRVFPSSNDARDVVWTLMRALEEGGVRVKTHSKLSGISQLKADCVLVATGGCNSPEILSLLESAGAEYTAPCPSLFTFRIEDEKLKSLSGITVPDARVVIPAPGISARGPLLLTDWGMSGPAALKLSANAARLLSERGYASPLLVNWCALNDEECRLRLKEAAETNPHKYISSVTLEGIPERLWKYLVVRSGCRAECRGTELGSKGLSRLVSTLCSDPHRITGRVRFKEEFVTCGGVSLKAVDPKRLNLKDSPSVFFAGEVLDIDAVTGGFNLQAAWTTGWCAANGIAEYIINKDICTTTDMACM